MSINGGFDPASWAILITSISTGVGSILTAIGNRRAIIHASNTAVESAKHVASKLSENENTVAKRFEESHREARSQITKISEIASSIQNATESISQATTGNLERMTQSLEEANQKITEIKSRYNIELINELQSQKSALENLNLLINDVRQRQHDFANYLNEIGLGFKLRPLENADPLPAPSKGE